jgi:hypothetical protein
MTTYKQNDMGTTIIVTSSYAGKLENQGPTLTVSGQMRLMLVIACVSCKLIGSLIRLQSRAD